MTKQCRQRQVQGDNNSPCSECGSGDIVYDDVGGEIVCKQCGFVISSNIIDPSPEWSAYTLEQRTERSRIGLPLTWSIPDKGLFTKIGANKRDSSGGKLRLNQMRWLNRMVRWNRRSKVSDSSETNLIFALAEMSKIAYKLRLPRIVLETASLNYRRYVKQLLTKNRSIKGVALASLYIACRQCGSVHSLDDISQAANFPRKKLYVYYSYLLKKTQFKVPPINHNKFVSMLVNHLALSGETEYIALKILKRVKELRLTDGRRPRGVAAAVTYLASYLTDEEITQDQIANEINLTKKSLCIRCKELNEKLNIILNL